MTTARLPYVSPRRLDLRAHIGVVVVAADNDKEN